MKIEDNVKRNKMPAPNERFHASGGADSYDTEQVTSSFALVRALPIPPPAAKPQGVRRHPQTAQCNPKVLLNKEIE